ncbi:nucleoside hydrolase [Mariniblastus fucicola]|uniref:Pyrimidine-specific ribonucleoside hydrolase RihA n=1 Tax=Mariniblastus fucicola TaxID=980251 RepID=A0A5B9PGM8_9BACT|nr:nucleoside hydrolase [Mariniblastus fucicola]QEG24385.1 Pyrimidine-specific ribonucleoside hydrolase RihA [Mariniblastus fucicola]
MPRKVIVDCDMGTDDVVALCMLLFDDRYEVLAITATEGCVGADQANENLQAVLTLLDPDRYPRVGLATPNENAPAVDSRFLYGDDGLGNANFEVSVPQNARSAEKLIVDTVRSNPDEVSILCLGPLTNVARAFRRDPQLPAMVDKLVMTGGSLNASGNITACAEFNFYFDPEGAREVLQSRAAKMLLPLEVTSEVKFDLGILGDMPKGGSRVGDLLGRIMPYTIRACRQQLGLEQVILNDAVGALSFLEPQLFEFESIGADVEVDGTLTRGVLVLDRRFRPECRGNVNIATSVRETAGQYITDQLTMAGQKSR